MFALINLHMLTERKVEEDRRKELEKRRKYEEEMSFLLRTWKGEILPSWDVMLVQKVYFFVAHLLVKLS